MLLPHVHTRGVRFLASGAALAVTLLLGAAWSGVLPVRASDPAVITACINPAGQMTLSDDGTCKKNEQPVSWNQAGQPGPEGPQGPTGADGVSVSVAPEPVGENCAYGGIAVSSASPTAYVCNGAPGATGPGGGGLSCANQTLIKAAIPAFESDPGCLQPPVAVDDYLTLVYSDNLFKWFGFVDVLANDSDPVFGSDLTLVSATADLPGAEVVTNPTGRPGQILVLTPNTVEGGFVVTYEIQNPVGSSATGSVFVTFQ